MIKINIITNIPIDDQNEFQIRIIGGDDTISIDFFSLQILLSIDSFFHYFYIFKIHYQCIQIILKIIIKKK